jgi:hypothetical protein
VTSANTAGAVIDMIATAERRAVSFPRVFIRICVSFCFDFNKLYQKLTNLATPGLVKPSPG